LDSVKNSEDVCVGEILTKLISLADNFVETAEKHFTEEETEVRWIIFNFSCLNLFNKLKVTK
jgi:hemerythrin